MRILVIDDLRVMNKIVREVSYARTSSGAIALLEAGRRAGFSWDMVFWDHDLGGDDTTIPILRKIEQWAFEGAPALISECFVHTANPVGAGTLMSVLSRHYPTRRVAASDYSNEVLGG